MFHRLHLAVRDGVPRFFIRAMNYQAIRMKINLGNLEGNFETVKTVNLLVLGSKELIKED